MSKFDEIIGDYKPDCALLTELGFIAIKQIDEDGAKKCFYASMALNPKEIMPVLGLGMVFMLNLELKEAIRLFEFALKEDPKNEAAQGMLAVAKMYQLSDSSIKEGNEIIQQLGSSSDPTIKELVKNVSQLKSQIDEKMKDLHPLETGREKTPEERLKDMK